MALPFSQATLNTGDTFTAAIADALQATIIDQSNILAAGIGDYAGSFPLTVPSPCYMFFDLYLLASAFTANTLTSDGYAVARSAPNCGYTPATWGGLPNKLQSGSTTTNTSAQLLVNKRIILPPLASVPTLNRMAASVRASGSANGGNCFLDKVDVVLEKIATGGAVTTLATATTSPGIASAASVERFTEIQVVNDFSGSPQTLASGDRLAVSLKLYGHSSDNVNQVTLTLNPTIDNTFSLYTSKNTSFLALDFA